MSWGACECCAVDEPRERVRGQLVCDNCAHRWRLGYAAALEDVAAGRLPDADAGASAHNIAEEAAQHGE